MARRTIYFSDEHDLLYLEVKRLAEVKGKTVGSVTVALFEKYINDAAGDKEDKQKGNETGDDESEIITLFIGERDPGFFDSGEYIKFFGTLIGSASCEVGKDVVRHQRLYFTKKKKFLLYTVDVVGDGHGGEFSSYEVFDKASELKDKELAAGLINGLKNLDVGSRFIDV